ncbi:hypothetical protein T552_04096 [Pneumocystis carinii B80]|uniref:PI-PLC Y-box domain-containing protein n=1 Tax=Pneumocystis carinii (strain B80) TaxID=1408658 RepID=A0A0W4ZN26_PNEC8|nr:hypothetical protein T552_04096 [Pneumocystis carinii B80]KTW29776.1 hypothetical protein T552_04096 [Pneumocystis carinii B80]
MGAQKSKIVFRRGIFRLFEESIPAENDYWKQFWELPESANDVFTLFSRQDIIRIRDYSETNIKTLVYVIASKLVFIREKIGDPERMKEALNCLRIITRVMPFIYEKESMEEWENEIFWSYRSRKKEFKCYSNLNLTLEELNLSKEEIDFKAHLKYTEIILNDVYEKENESEYEILKPLAEELLDTLNDMLFFSGFTVYSKENDVNKITYSVWEPGIGCVTSIKATTEYELNRIEVLRCILSIISKSIYFYPNKQKPNLYIIYLVTNPDKRFILTFLCSLLNTVMNYNLEKWRIFYNQIVSLDSKQLLVSYCVQILLIFLDYEIPSLLDIEKNQTSEIPVNKYCMYFGKLHHKGDIEFLFNGINRILTQFLHNDSYFPAIEKHMKYCPEVIMFLWKVFQINNSFKEYLINSKNSLDYLVLLLSYTLEYRKELSKFGLIRICISILQTLSRESAFCKKLNATFEHYKILPVNIKLISKDNYMDFIIISIYMLITTSKGALSCLFPYMLSILINIAPYAQNLSILSCTKLMQLFYSFSSFSFLLANENNHNLLRNLLEVFNRIIEHQMKKNLHLIYAILRSSERFELLKNFTLEKALIELEKNSEFKKNELNNVKNDTKEFHKDNTCFSEKSPLPQTSFQDNNPFVIEDDESNSQETNSENTTVTDKLSKGKSSISLIGTSTSAFESHKINNSFISEKAKGKLPERLKSSSDFTKTNPFHLNTYTPKSILKTKENFTPTEDWVKSWHSSLDLDTILTIIKQLKPKINDIASSTPNPNIILEALSSLSIDFDITDTEPIPFICNDHTLTRIEGLLWGHIYVAETNFSTGAIGIWTGTSIKLFRIQETKHSPSLLSPKGAVDAVAKSVIDKVGNLNFYTKKLQN